MTTADAVPPVGSPAPLTSSPRFRALGIGLGILSIILGILVLALPVATLVFVAIMFAIELIVLGGVRIAVASKTPAAGWVRILGIVLGALTIIVGILCIFRPAASLLLLAIFLAAGWIADGIADLARAFQGGRGAGSTIFLVIGGIVTIIAGIVVVIFPGASLLLLAKVAGIVLIIVGVVQAIAAIMHHGSAKTGSAAKTG